MTFKHSKVSRCWVIYLLARETFLCSAGASCLLSRCSVTKPHSHLPGNVLHPRKGYTLVPTLLNIGKRKEKRLAKTEIAEGAKEWTKIPVSQLSCLEGSPVVLARKLSVFEGCYAPTVLHLQAHL